MSEYHRFFSPEQEVLWSALTACLPPNVQLEGDSIMWKGTVIAIVDLNRAHDAAMQDDIELVRRTARISKQRMAVLSAKLLGAKCLIAISPAWQQNALDPFIENVLDSFWKALWETYSGILVLEGGIVFLDIHEYLSRR